MTAQSFAPGSEPIELFFQPFAMPSGRLMRMRETITRVDADHIVKDQHFALAGCAGKWLGHRYASARNK